MPHRRPLTQQEGWLAPHSRFRSASPDVYAEYIVSTCRSGWRAADMPLCFRQRSCPHSFLSQMLHSAPSGGESCSTRLRRAGCVDLPTHLTSHRDGATAMFRKLCGWLAPRDGCSCLPCFTECRRSELCPPPSANSAVAPPLPSGSPNGSFAFAFSLRLPAAKSIEASQAAHAKKLAVLRELLRAVVSLVWTKTRHSIVLLSDGVPAPDLAPFRRLGVRLVRLAPPPEGLDKAHKRHVTFAKACGTGVPSLSPSPFP